MAIKDKVTQENKRKPVMETMIFGAISISAYVAIFMNEKWVIETFTKGNWYAAYPIVAALFFSFVHGAFTSNLITTFGLEEKK